LKFKYCFLQLLESLCLQPGTFPVVTAGAAVSVLLFGRQAAFQLHQFLCQNLYQKVLPTILAVTKDKILSLI
jgi:hypothetical protein